MSAARHPRIGLVIGSGGLKCAAALGLWKALLRAGIEPDMAVGCSGGSVYASLIALGRTIEEVEALNLMLWTDTFSRRSYRSLLGAIFPRFFDPRRFGLVDDRRMNFALRTLFGDKTFADARIPLSVVATTLDDGQKVVMNEGSIFDAVRASVAIPLAIAPWPVGGRLMVDGGASDPLPLDVAIREGCEIIIAMGFEQPSVPTIGSMMSLTLQATTTTINNLLRSTYSFYSLAHHAEIIAVMPSFDRRIGLTQVSEMPYIIEMGEIAAEREMPYLKRLLEAGAGEVRS